MCIKFGDPDSQGWKGHRQLQRQSLTTHRFARSREGKPLHGSWFGQNLMRGWRHIPSIPGLRVTALETLTFLEHFYLERRNLRCLWVPTTGWKTGDTFAKR